MATPISGIVTSVSGTRVRIRLFRSCGTPTGACHESCGDCGASVALAPRDILVDAAGCRVGQQVRVLVKRPLGGTFCTLYIPLLILLAAVILNTLAILDSTLTTIAGVGGCCLYYTIRWLLRRKPHYQLV